MPRVNPADIDTQLLSSTRRLVPNFSDQNIKDLHDLFCSFPDEASCIAVMEDDPATALGIKNRLVLSLQI